MHAMILTPFALAATIAAQTVSVTVQTPATLTASFGAQSQTVVLPAGPGAQFGSATAVAGGATASVDWDTFVDPTGVILDVSSRVSGASVSGTTAAASVTGFDLVYRLSNPTPIAVELQLRRLSSANAGLLAVDVGNDGSVELSDATVAETRTLSVTIGPAPLEIRVQSAASIVAAGLETSLVQISAFPSGGFVVSEVAPGCDTGHRQTATPIFDGGLRLRVVGPLAATRPSVTILGVSTQPTLWSVPAPVPFPCLLLPSPDVALPGWTSTDLYLPAAAAPYVFWVQAVVWRPTDLRTTPALTVVGF